MLKLIKNEDEHDAYMARAYELMQRELKPNSQESDELEVISILIEAYEKEHYPIEDPNPILLRRQNSRHQICYHSY